MVSGRNSAAIKPNILDIANIRKIYGRKALELVEPP